MTTKTLGQVLYEAIKPTSPIPWVSLSGAMQADYEALAQAVADAHRPVVLDECATQIRTLTEELARCAASRDDNLRQLRDVRAELNNEIQKSMALRTKRDEARTLAEGLESLRADAAEQLNAAWLATGVQSTVRGLTSLADVVGTHRTNLLAAIKERDLALSNLSEERQRVEALAAKVRDTTKERDEARAEVSELVREVNALKTELVATRGELARLESAQIREPNFDPRVTALLEYARQRHEDDDPILWFHVEKALEGGK